VEGERWSRETIKEDLGERLGKCVERERERVEAWSIAAESPVAAPNGRAVRLWLVDLKRRGKIVRYWFKIQKNSSSGYLKSIIIT
jgi:ABC-type thiamine transport system substrate-binding protein